MGDAERGQNGERPCQQRQQVHHGEAGQGRTGGARRVPQILSPAAQDLAAHVTGHAGGAADGDRHHDRNQSAAARGGDDRQGQNEWRETGQDFDDAQDPEIDPPAAQAGEGAEQPPRQQSEKSRAGPDQQ